MKTIKNLIRPGLILLIAMFLANCIYAQRLDKATVKSMLDSKNFIFKAQTALPLGQISRQLTSDYDMKVLGDSLVTYLPYFGRAYAPVAPGDGGINFTSTDFEYKLKARKKGGWELSLSPKDAKDVRQLNLTISESGYANLQVNSNNRQSISFYGYLVNPK